MPHDHPDKKETHEDSLFKGLVIGAVVGAGILWLFGTDSGKKLKQEIEDEGKDLVKKVTGTQDDEVILQDDDEDFVSEKLPIIINPTPNTPVKRAIKTATTAAKKEPPKTGGKRFFKKRA